MMEPLFGTDGVRGIANLELTPEIALSLGLAFGTYLKNQGISLPEVLVGKDGRMSGDMLEAAISAGLASTGCVVHQVGIIPTPALSHFIVAGYAQGGVMISASHNPVQDNGIKFFQQNGEKLLDEQEKQVEEIFREIRWNRANPTHTGKIWHRPEWKQKYIDLLLHLLPIPHTKGGKREIILDCAYGAMSEVAPEVLSRLGWKFIQYNAQPDGLRINVGCGSTHPEFIAWKTREHRAFCGISFDGDGDRAIFAAPDGNILDGDNILLSMTKRQGQHWLQSGWNPVIVGTEYTNSALEEALSHFGFALFRAQPGDKNVFLQMKKSHSPAGGETSGHIVFSEYTRTGDGLVTVLLCLNQIFSENGNFTDWSEELKKVPQLLASIPLDARKKYAIIQDAEFLSLLDEMKNQMHRVFVRPSGTENVLRVLVEASEQRTARDAMHLLTAFVQKWGEKH